MTELSCLVAPGGTGKEGMASIRSSMRLGFKRSNGASEKDNSADFALVDFYDAISVVPMELVTMKKNAEGSVDDNAVIVQWKVGNKRKPYEGVILFKGSKEECEIEEGKELKESDEEEDKELKESDEEEDKESQEIGDKSCVEAILPPKPKARKESTAPRGPKKTGRQRKSKSKDKGIKKGKTSKGKRDTSNKENENGIPKFIVHVTASPPKPSSQTSSPNPPSMCSLKPKSFRSPLKEVASGKSQEIVSGNQSPLENSGNITNLLPQDEQNNHAQDDFGGIADDDEIHRTNDFGRITDDDDDDDIHRANDFGDTTDDDDKIHRADNFRHKANDADIQAEIRRINDEQEFRFDQIIERLDRMEDSIKLLFTSGVASVLAKNRRKQPRKTSPNGLCINYAADQTTTGNQVLMQYTANQTTLGDHSMTQSTANQTTLGDHSMTQSTANQTTLGDYSMTQSTANQTTLGDHSVTQPTADQTTLGDHSVTQPTADQTTSDQSKVNNQREKKIKDLIPPALLVPIVCKHKSRRSLAAGLVQQLVDQDTWLKSNVNGDKKKKRINPDIIAYVEAKCFEYHPFNPRVDKDYKTSWQECVTAIDNKGRDIKRRLKLKSSKEV